jgi:signal transduction histidine kinase
MEPFLGAIAPESGIPSAAALRSADRAILDAPEGNAELLLRSTLDALSAHIAVLDDSANIVGVNEAWRTFAAQSGYEGGDCGIGVNYLAVCERAAPHSADAARTAQALREMVAGSRVSFRMEYPCIGPDGPRWFQLRITRPAAPVRRIVVAHEDITDVKRAEDRLARLNARLFRLQDEERRRIARELHDSTAQNLLVISLNAARLRDAQRLDTAAKAAAEILDVTERTLQEIRTISYLLHPPLLDDLGLESALRWMARGFGQRSGTDIDVQIDEIGAPLPREVATALFRVAQEALSNVHRHSGSSWARLALHRRGEAVELVVEDRGCGFGSVAPESGEGPAPGVGIAGMRVRIEQVGGRLDLRSRPTGLLLTATVPLSRAA